MSVHHVHAVPEEVSRGQRSPGTRVRDGCEASCGCWKLNLGTQEEQPGLLTSEPSLQNQSLRFSVN